MGHREGIYFVLCRRINLHIKYNKLQGGQELTQVDIERK